MIDALKNIKINNDYCYLFMAKKNIFDEDYKVVKDQIFQDLKKIK